MAQLQSSIVFATLAGAMIPLGGILARVEHIRPQWLEEEFRHSVIAFGGGILLAAVSLVLVPRGITSYLSPAWSLAAFAAGGLVFFSLDRLIERRGGSAAQLVAMVADFVPEAIAMGAMFASGDSAGPLLALLIGL